MADGFELVGWELQGHAGRLVDFTDRLRQAVDAAQQVSMPIDAYGILCQPFRALLDPVENYGVDALNGAVTAMEAAAKGVRDTARAYEDTETGNDSSLQDIG